MKNSLMTADNTIHCNCQLRLFEQLRMLFFVKAKKQENFFFMVHLDRSQFWGQGAGMGQGLC